MLQNIVNNIYHIHEIVLTDKTSTTDIAALRSNKPEFILMHSTYSYDTFEKLLEYHKSRGWSGVGYHLFVDKEGNAFQARPLEKEGSHALGFNFNSASICIFADEETQQISNKQEQVGQYLIAEIQRDYGNLPILSHTEAQIMYFNKLAEKHNLDHRIRAPENCEDPIVFAKLKQEVDNYIGSLNTDDYYTVKQQFKKLKNCPGPYIKKFRK